MLFRSGYQDAAVVVFSRIGGEGFDLPRAMAESFNGAAVAGASADSHYLELDENGKALLEHVKDNFSKVIVVLNVGTTMEIPELKADEDIDAILWIGFPGATGIIALGQILTGTDTEGNQISPSGHTVDTWAADSHVTPLPFGIDRIESQGRFTRTGQAGQHDQLITGQLNINIFQVMLTRTFYINMLLHG